MDITVSGGTPTYNFLWSNGETASLLDSIFAGSYIVIITDSLGCNINQSFTLNAEAVSFSISTIIDSISCSGLCDGSIDLTVIGGTTGYSYSWYDGATTEDRDNLCAGIYSVAITDQIVPPPYMFNWTYNYNIDNHIIAVPFNSVLVNGLPPEQGDVLGVFYDNNGSQECGGYQEWTGSNIIVMAMRDNNITIPKDGFDIGESLVWKLWRQSDSIEVNLNATYDINEPNQGDFQIGGISAINSLNGSFSTAGLQVMIFAFQLSEPEPLLISDDVIQISTQSSMAGSINLNIQGGYSTYSYLWDSGDTTNFISSLDTGYYVVTVSDSYFCQIVDSFYLAYDSIPAIIQNSTITNPSCNGYSDGVIITNISGGIPGYSFLWSNGETIENLDSLGVGVYDLTITDYSGQIEIFSFELIEPQEIEFSSYIQNVSSFGNNDGLISLSVVGGTPPFSFLMPSASNYIPSFSNLESGNYSLTISDSQGCSKYPQLYVDFPTSNYPIEITGVHTDNICNGDTLGDISVSFSGGYPPYDFIWNTNDTTQNLTNLMAGTYAIIVQDDFINYGFSSSLPWNYINTGIYHSITLPQSAAYIDGSPLPYGSLIGFFFEENGLYHCAGYTSWQGPSTIFAVYGDDPATAIKEGFSENEVFKVLVYSNGMYYYAPSAFNDLVPNSSPNNFQPYGSSLIEQLFSLTTIETFIITEPTALNINPIVSNYNGFNVSFFSASDGFIDISVSGATPPYTYLWSNGETTEDVQNLVAGIYELTVTDFNMCDTVLSVEVTSPPLDPITANATITIASCNGLCNGDILIQASGGIPPLNFAWSNGETTMYIDSLCAGLYELTISDLDSTLVLSLEIIQPDSITADFIVSPVDPVSGINGVIDATIVGGTVPYIYQWSDGSTIEDILDAEYGQYFLTVSDNNSCMGLFETFVELSVYPDWNVYQTSLSHEIFIPQTATLVLNGFLTDNYDFIGLFYDSLGIEKCAGFIMWQGQSIILSAYGDDNNTPEIEGFSIGEEFRWRFWDASENLEHNAYAVYSQSFPQQNLFALSGSSGIDSLYNNSISGSVYITTKSNLETGMVVLYEQTTNGYYAVARGSVINGQYLIEGLKTGSYLTYAIPMPGNDWGIPGYYVTRDDWQGATWVNVNANVTDINITLDPVIPYNTGVGAILGNIYVGSDNSYNPDVFDDEWFAGSIKDDETPARNIPVLLYDSLMNALDFRLSNELGSFEFEQLELGTYYVRVEKAGLQSDEVEITLTEANPISGGSVFSLESGQVVSVSETFVKRDINIYPNPFNDAFTIKGIKPNDKIKIYGILGKEQNFQVSDDLPFTINLRNNKAGLYFIMIEREKEVTFFKVVKQ